MSKGTTTEGFFLVGRFPLGIHCSVDANAAVIFGKDLVRINNELDSPVFLYKHKNGYFIQMAAQTNGSKILIHEEYVEFFDENEKPINLADIKVEAIGETKSG